MSSYNTTCQRDAIECLDQTESILSGKFDALFPCPFEPCSVQASTLAPGTVFHDGWELKSLFLQTQNNTIGSPTLAHSTPFCAKNDFTAGIHSTVSSSSVSETSSVGTFEDDFDVMLSQLPFLDDNVDNASQIAEISFPIVSLVPNSVMTSANVVELPNKCKVKVTGVKRTRKYQSGQWNERYQEMLHFHRQHGHLFVPHSYPPNQKLAQWVKRQRYQFKLKHTGQHSTLSDDRENLLSNVGFIWDSHAASWQEQFQLLAKFFKAHGHCNVPTRFQGSSALNVWCKHQRKQYKLFKCGVSCTLTQEKVDHLNAIGFNWSPRKSHNDIP